MSAPFAGRAAAPGGVAAAEVESEAVIAAVSTVFGVTAESLRGPSRNAEVVRARQCAMYVLRNHMALSLPRIGELLGRHHTTVMHAVRKVEALVAAGDDISGQLAAVVDAAGCPKAVSGRSATLPPRTEWGW